MDENRTFRRLLIEVRDELLRELDQKQRQYGGEMPTVLTINGGWCDEFASRVVESFPKARSVWLNELRGGAHLYHCVVRYAGRFYDAECIDGVDDFRELPYAENFAADSNVVAAKLKSVFEARGWYHFEKSSRGRLWHVVVTQGHRPHELRLACDSRVRERALASVQEGPIPEKDKMCRQCLYRCRYKPEFTGHRRAAAVVIGFAELMAASGRAVS